MIIISHSMCNLIIKMLLVYYFLCSKNSLVSSKTFTARRFRGVSWKKQFLISPPTSTQIAISRELYPLSEGLQSHTNRQSYSYTPSHSKAIKIGIHYSLWWWYTFRLCFECFVINIIKEYFILWNVKFISAFVTAEKSLPQSSMGMMKTKF